MAVGLSPEVCEIVLSGTSTGQAALVVTNPLDRSKGLAIEDDDFPLLEKAAESVVAFIEPSGAAFAAVVVANLVLLGYAFHKKNIQLNGLQLAIINELKANPGITYDNLAVLLGGSNIQSDDIRNELLALSNIRKNDGTLTSLVTEDSSGNWRVKGI